MIDISKQKVEIECPSCKKKVKITLKQVADEKTVKCTCGQKIELEDKNQQAKKAIKDMNKAFEDLKKTLNNLGKY